MKSLAPIVDRMRELAREELPTPRTCEISLWGDGTFDVVIYHSMAGDESQRLRYERTTGEILREHASGAEWEVTEFSDGETLHESVPDEIDVRRIEQVDPPYR